MEGGRGMGRGGDAQVLRPPSLLGSLPGVYERPSGNGAVAQGRVRKERGEGTGLMDLSALKPPELALVNYLRAHPGKFFDRATLNHMVFNDTYALPTINFYIWSIREKLGRGSIKTRLYRNNRPAGYAWVVEFVGGAE